MRLAVLDVGSNTVHLVVVDGQPDGTFVPVARERETLRLAEAAFPAMLLPEEAVERLIATVLQMRDCSDELGTEVLVGFATSAIREARNGVEALRRVREETGVAVAVLPGPRRRGSPTWPPGAGPPSRPAACSWSTSAAAAWRSPRARVTGPGWPRACRWAPPGCRAGSCARTRWSL